MFFEGINVASLHSSLPLWRGNIIASHVVRHLQLRNNFLKLTKTIRGSQKVYHRGRSSQKEILFPNKNITMETIIFPRAREQDNS